MTDWYYESDGDVNRRTHYLTSKDNDRIDFDSKKQALEALEKMKQQQTSEVLLTTSGRAERAEQKVRELEEEIDEAFRRGYRNCDTLDRLEFHLTRWKQSKKQGVLKTETNVLNYRTEKDA